MSKQSLIFFRVLRSTLPHSPRFHFSKSTDKLRESINNTANTSTFLTFSFYSFIDYTLAASVVNPQQLNVLYNSYMQCNFLSPFYFDGENDEILYNFKNNPIQYTQHTMPTPMATANILFPIQE